MRVAFILLSLLVFVGCDRSSETTGETDAGSAADTGASCARPCGSACCTGAEECTNGFCRVPCTPSCSGKKCGYDGCWGSCGSCGTGLTCGASFTCETCKPKSCADLQASCGNLADGCGKQLDCGTCTAPRTCGGGGKQGVCGCTPKLCTPGMCGQLSDGCGARIDCGRCGAGEYCGATQTCLTGTCPRESDRDFCARLGANCDTVTAFDNCDSSRTVSCGVCTSPQVCGINAPNVCGDDCRRKPCTGFTWCDQGSGQCRPGCQQTTQCGANQSCDTGSHTCVCAAGSHTCSDACVLNVSTATCGSSCFPCPAAPANGIVTCDGTKCGFSCDRGFHPCGSACLSNTAVASCGARCTTCPTGDNGTPLCDSGACKLQCSTGHLYCSGKCIPCSDPNGTPTCGAGGTCAFTCGTGYHFEGGKCVANVACDFSKGCGTGSHCNYAEKVCYAGKASCVSDGECGTSEACDLKTGACVKINRTWTCTSTCYNFSGACGSGSTCSNGTCVSRGDGSPCKPGIECGGNYECSEYDWRCRSMSCTTCNCAQGMECVYGSSCSGCGSYGGGGSYYNSCWPVRTHTACSPEGALHKGFKCVGGKYTMRWPCSVRSDCSGAYSCGSAGTCVPYYETLCTTGTQCPNTYDYRCDASLGVCLPK